MCAEGLHAKASAKTKAVGDLATIAFYFLLRVGEYTMHSKKQRRRTQQFRVRDITFRRKGCIIPSTADLATLLTATSVTMRLDNQKNGKRGAVLHHEATDTLDNPVAALARRVAHILSHTDNLDTIIGCYWNDQGTKCFVTQRNITDGIRAQIRKLGMEKYGYTSKLVSSHSLRAGGAMAMHLNKADPTRIRKMGRWSSDTFLMYIHEQIAAFSAGWAKRMSNDIVFENIAGPDLMVETTSPK